MVLCDRSLDQFRPTAADVLTNTLSSRTEIIIGTVVGDILPLALGIAISPIPIIAAILMLLSPKARATSIGFWIGWILGIVVGVGVFTLLAAVIPQPDTDQPQPVAGVIKILLGLLMIMLPSSSGGDALIQVTTRSCRSGCRRSIR